MFDWSRGARNRKLLEKAGSDPAQKRITEFYNILTDIEKLIESNEKLSLMLQNARTSMYDDEHPISCKEQFSAVLKQIVINAERNVEQVPTQRRHPTVLKKFSTALYIYSGPLAYEFIQQNMPEALPSVRTLQTAIHAEYKTIDEGCFRFDDLAEHLKKYGGITAVSIGEDATRVIGRVDYDPETDRCVGFVLPVNESGLPIIDSFQVMSFSAIESMFKNNSVAKYAYVYMAQSLCQNVPSFCLACVGTNNKFTAENVCLLWKYIYMECEKRNIHVLSFGADGDSRLLKAMRVTMSLMTDKSDPLLKHLPSYSLNSPAIPKEWHTWFCTDPKPVSCVQDTVHIAVKLKSRLLNPLIILRMGCYVAEGNHLRKIQTKYQKDQHGLREQDLNHQDKQNYDAVLRIVNASHLLDNIAEAHATKCYVELMKSVIDSFLDKSLDPLVRIEKLWSVVFFLRYWRQWILVNCQCSLKDNFITYNAYMCIEINAHSLITFLMTVRDQLNKDSASFLPWLLGSQSCERVFRSARSMSSTFSTIINFGMLGLLRRLHRLQILSTIQSETSTGIIFPRVLKHQSKQGDSVYKNHLLEAITNDNILASVNRARDKARVLVEELGMVDLLKKFLVWDTLEEGITKNEGEDESDDDGNNEDNDGVEEKSQVILSDIVNEVCTEQPSQIAVDLKAISESGLIDDALKSKLEQQQKMLPLTRIPSSTVSMFIVDEGNKGKSKHVSSSKKHFPFVEVQANGQNVFIRKTTAVWLLQEGERVSSDRLFRVRCKQPFAIEPLKVYTDTIPVTSPSITAPKVNVIDLDACCSSSQATVNSVIVKNMEDNSWLKVGSITLYLDDKQSILNGERLTGSQIIVAQSLLKTQFPHFNGLEDTLLLFHEKRKRGPICPETVQILHVDGNHWITVSSLGHKNRDDSTSGNESDITVYDSIYFRLSKHTEILLAKLLQTKQRSFTVKISSVNKQAGIDDCGVFAVAYCTSLVYGQNPSTFVYNQTVMRTHLVKCLENKKLEPFPILRERRIGKFITVQVEVFCYCRSPNDGSPMVRCDNKHCREWFHISCIDMKITKGQKWYCMNCK